MRNLEGGKKLFFPFFYWDSSVCHDCFNFIKLLFIFGMLSQKKQQGFIIRKSRKPAEDHQQRKRYMSQTQFYRKGHSQTPGIRTPGQIIHIKFKDEIGHIRQSHSNWFGNNDDLSSNPQSNLPGIKFKYQQSKNDLRQKGDGFDREADEKSVQSIETGSRVNHTAGLNIEKNINVTKIMDKLQYQLQHRTSSSEILNCTKEYIAYINDNELASINNLQIPPFRKKIIKQSLLNERISIVMVSLMEILGKFEQLKSYALNLINFSIDNMLLRLAILTEGKEKAVIELLTERHKERFLNKGFEVIKNNIEMMNEGINKISRIDNLLYENLKKLLKTNKTLHVKGQFAALQQYIAFYLWATNHAQKAPFLSVAPAPYLPEQQFEKYTLVIDVLECFCTKSKKATQSFRPFAEYFLDEMSQYYELVCFSDAMPVEVNRVVSLLDRKKLIKHKLYNYHTDKSKSFNGKDLTRLGRNMKSIILIDTNSQNQSNNTIVVNPWKGKRNDAELAQLCPVLAMIALKKMCPQTAIKKLHEKNEENQRMGLKYINCGINFE